MKQIHTLVLLAYAVTNSTHATTVWRDWQNPTFGSGGKEYKKFIDDSSKGQSKQTQTKITNIAKAISTIAIAAEKVFIKGKKLSDKEKNGLQKAIATITTHYAQLPSDLQTNKVFNATMQDFQRTATTLLKPPTAVNIDKLPPMKTKPAPRPAPVAPSAPATRTPPPTTKTPPPVPVKKVSDEEIRSFIPNIKQMLDKAKIKGNEIQNIQTNDWRVWDSSGTAYKLLRAIITREIENQQIKQNFNSLPTECKNIAQIAASLSSSRRDIAQLKNKIALASKSLKSFRQTYVSNTSAAGDFILTTLTLFEQYLINLNISILNIN